MGVLLSGVVGRRVGLRYARLAATQGGCAMDPETKAYTPRERVGAAYKGGYADRVPAYPIAGSFAGCLDDLSIEEYCTNPTKAAKAMLLRNPELMCLDTIDDPAFVHDLMRFSTEYAKRWGDAVLTTRIGLSYTDPTASCSLVGPDTYREFIKPYHKELVEYFKAKKVGTTVHICGTTHQIHEDLVDVGFVAITIDLDQQADPTLYVDQLDRLITLGNQRNVVAIGNVDVTMFERATKAEIEAEVRRCIDTAGSRSRFVLSTSCELPPRANPDCVKWFMEAAREYGGWERILGG